MPAAVVENDAVTLFIQQKSSLRVRGTPAAFGGTSDASASNYVSTINQSSGNSNVKLPSDVVVKYMPVYWVRVNDKMFSFNNEKQFLTIPIY